MVKTPLRDLVGGDLGSNCSNLYLIGTPEVAVLNFIRKKRERADF
jgi:hypothetical protein